MKYPHINSTKELEIFTYVDKIGKDLELSPEKVFELQVMMSLYIYLHNTDQKNLFDKPWKTIIKELTTIL